MYKQITFAFVFMISFLSVAQNGDFSLITPSSDIKLRVASYNVHFGSTFPQDDGSEPNVPGGDRVNKFARIANALKPDVWVFQETLYSRGAKGKTPEGIKAYMESMTGESWYVSYDRHRDPETDAMKGGRYLCSKYPILWDDIISGNSMVSIIDLPNSVSEKDLLVVNVHFRADNAVTGTARWLRKFLDGQIPQAQPEDLMVMITGDFNNQEGAQRYRAIMSADESAPNNYTPEWEDLKPTHLGYEGTEGADHTIGGVAFDNGELLGIYKKRIDYMFWKSDALKVKHAHVFNTLIMNQSTLNQYGLQEADVALNALSIGARDSIGCDHFPYFVDLIGEGNTTGSINPVDSAYYDFSDMDYSNGIVDQWNGNDLSSLSASQVDDGVNQFASLTGVESASGNAGELEFTSAKATIESWINLNTNTGVTQRIVSINPSGAILFRVSPEGSLQAVLTNDIEGANTKQTLTSPNKLPNEVWTHVAAAISENEIIFYINGQEDSRFSLNNPFDYDGAGSDLQIMLGSSNVGPVGFLDEVKIYNRTLSGTEIQTSFESYNIKPEAYLSVNPSANITEGDIVDVTWGGTDVHGTITSTEIYRNGKIRNWGTPFQWTAIAGTHTIEVVVTDNDGAKDTIAVTLEVDASNVTPVASLSINPNTNITEGDAVNITFSGTDADGTVESVVLLQNGVLRNWSSPYSWTSFAGQNTFEVIVTDNEGAKDTASVDIVISSPTVNIPPVSNITASPNSNLRVGDVVTLTFGGTDADGMVESITLKQNNQLRTWSSPYAWTATSGTHEFEVTVTDNEGAQHTSSIILNVSANVIPRTNLSVVPNSNVTEGDELEVTFSGSDSDGTIVSTTIQLNGVTQNWTSPQKIAATKGTMLFEVIVEDNDGAISKASITIQVSEETPNIEPEASLGILPDTNLIVGDEVEITFGGDDEDGTIESVLIYLNGVEQNWTSPHVWIAEKGEHIIEVVVTDNEGATNTISQSVNVESIQTSVNVVNNEYQVSVYPNPTNEYFIVDVNLSVSSVLEFCFYSARGDLITKRVIRTNQGISKQCFQVDDLGLPDGVVLIQIQDGESMITKKIIVKD